MDDTGQCATPLVHSNVDETTSVTQQQPVKEKGASWDASVHRFFRYTLRSFRYRQSLQDNSLY